jgi:hypothetical protein
MSWSDEEQNSDPFGAEGFRSVPRSPLGSILRNWTPKRIVSLSIALMLLITAADTLLGPRIILIGLLMGRVARSSAADGARRRWLEPPRSGWPCFWPSPTGSGTPWRSSHSLVPSCSWLWHVPGLPGSWNP